MKLLSKRNAAIFIAACLLYSYAYLAIRNAHWLVHRTGYYSVIGEGKKLDGHFISPGNFGTPMLAPFISSTQGISSMIFWPLAQVELFYWRSVAPHGSQWQTSNQAHYPNQK